MIDQPIGPRKNFDSSYLERDNTIRARHGRPWTSVELANLGDFFNQGWSLHKMCDTLERSAGGVVPQLVKLGLIEADDRTGGYRVVGGPSHKPKPNQETSMKDDTPVIQTKTFIAGVDASEMSDEKIFRLIAKIETDIRSWTTVETRPKKLDALIDKLKADVKALVEYVDSRA